MLKYILAALAAALGFAYIIFVGGLAIGSWKWNELSLMTKIIGVVPAAILCGLSLFVKEEPCDRI